MRIRHIVGALLNRENTPALRSYATFADALRDSDTYEDSQLIEVVKEKTKRYRDTLASSTARAVTTRQAVQNMFVLSYVEPQRKINVLEIGGACGASYFETKHLLPNRIAHWSIAETPVMAAAGAGLNSDASVNSDPGLSFHSDLAAAAAQLASRDLAVAQGVLQYAGDPLQMLRALFELQFSFVYVTRTAVADVHSPVFIKQDTELAAHGPGHLPNAPKGRSTQPMTLVSRKSLLSVVPANYEIVFEFDEAGERILSIEDDRVTVRDVGFLARLQPH